MFETVSVIGGDLRQLTLARLLKAEGYHVFLYGFDKDDTILDGLHNESDIDYVLGADIIVLPVPVTFDGVTVNSPYSAEPLGVEELLDNVNPSAIVFGGQIKPNLVHALEERGIAYRDYLKREELAIRNAIPTVLAVESLISCIIKYMLSYDNDIILQRKRTRAAYVDCPIHTLYRTSQSWLYTFPYNHEWNIQL